MAQKIPIYLPTFISDQNYNPNRVLPRLFFYNGTLESEEIWLGNPGGSSTAVNEFPYFDHYNVISGSFPTTGSRSLLFNNEAPAYGSIPTENLYTTYWSNYIELLYNPKTRLINCSAIIPLADYFDMELNDIVNWRGNYYHLRAINDFSLKDGSCKLQLLGPIIADTFDGVAPPVTQSFSSVSWSLDETSADATFTANTNGINRATATFDSVGNFRLTGSEWITASIVGAGTWGTDGPTTMSLVVSSSGYTFSGTSNTYGTPVTTTFTGSTNVTYYISASTQYNPVPTINFDLTGSCNGTDAEVTMSNASGGSGQYQFNTIAYLTEAGALAATSNYVTTSSVNFVNQPDGTYYFVVRDLNYPSVKRVKPYTNSCNIPSASLDWSFTISGGGTGTMDIFVNSSNVEGRNSNSNGVWPLYEGDEIYVEITNSGCSGGNATANAYTLGDILVDASCTFGVSTTSLTTTTYTVQASDMGTTLNLDCFATCDGGCV